MIWAGILAALRHPDATARLAASLAEPVAWPEVVAEVRRLRVAPLFYAGIQDQATAAMPRAVRESFRRAALAAGARAAYLEAVCASVTTAASSEGIPVLLLKGLALQHLVYPPGIVRQMDDVDLLVSPTGASRFGALLRRLGYRNDLRGEEDFVAPDRAHSIDVHTRLVNATRVPARGALWAEPFEDVWARRQAVAIGGIAAWALGPRDGLQHLAVHAVHHHGMQGVVWMADLLAALHTWPGALRETRRAPAGVRRSVWYCLDVLASRGHDPVPDHRAALQPRWLFPGERRILSLAGNAECSSRIRYAFTLACLPGWATRAVLLRQLLIPRDGVYAKGFLDAGPAPRRAWLAHWGHLVRLARRGGLCDRSE